MLDLGKMACGILSLGLIFGSNGVGASVEPFRFHLLTEPHTLDPQTTGSNSGNYLFQNLYRGLFSYHSQRGLEPLGAKSCTRGPLVLICHLNPAHRWSNGRAIVAEDYVRAFRRLVEPLRKSPQSEIVLSLKNGREILAGSVGPEKLGVIAIDEYTLRFEFREEDPEFEFKLINPATAPWPKEDLPERTNSSELVVSGPYKIQAWKSGHWINLVPNENYGLHANPSRPNIEVLFIENDATALRLYESGKLSFLRRLTFEEIPRFRERADFHQIAMARFDYFGFGPELEDQPVLREALLSAVDFDSFQSLTPTKGPIGCASLPERMVGEPICLKYDLAKAKRLFAKVKNPPKLKLFYSKMGGDDVARAVEWLQGQWKKNLGFMVELNPEEQIVYLRRLRDTPPALFRKGIGLDRPTCRAALETFTEHHPENFLKLHDRSFEKLVQSLNARQSSTKSLASDCRKAIAKLFAMNRLMPLGEMYFTILMPTRYVGWDLNEINQLDLSDLRLESQ